MSIFGDRAAFGGLGLGSCILFLFFVFLLASLHFLLSGLIIAVDNLRALFVERCVLGKVLLL